MKDILVVIPYLDGEAQGNELEYAVEGWKRHFQEPHQIVVVGDRAPVMPDVTFIDCPRVEGVAPDNYVPHIDHVNKFKKVREAFPKSKGFIYTCDDIYAVNDFGMEEILVPKIHSWDMVGDFKSPNGWKRDVARTRELCVREGLPVWDWVCHLPVYYEWDKLLKIWQKYDCANRSYVVENIYFNTYYRTRKPILVDDEYGNFKFGIYTSRPNYARLLEAFRDKIWITNSPTGWVLALTELLDNYYFPSK